jgi:hypothetical protein
MGYAEDDIQGWKTSLPHGDKDSAPIGRHVDIYPVDDQGKRIAGIKKGKVSFDETKPKVDGIKGPKR